MRRLLLLRHAKSSWDRADLDDMSRPLAPRGRKAAPLIGRHISGRDLVPALVLCSTAERARQTLELVVAEWERAVGDGAKVEMRASLYLASVGELLSAIRRLDDDIESVMMIGHNPGMAILASQLAATGDPEALKTMAAKFPTAALAVLDFEVSSWQAVGPGTGGLQSFVRPKDLT
ncbi:MAG: histidine phosphatase family protein [Alphaproteobacteria bacterium]|nr:histidine phosphatase family protein [Alphaproteobacteria bacterium]